MVLPFLSNLLCRGCAHACRLALLSVGAFLGAQVQPPALPEPVQPAPHFPKLVFSFNKGSGITGNQWTVLTRYADLVMGLDGHGYEFPGYLDDLRVAAPARPAFAFVTAMALQRQGIQDSRFRYLDHYEGAFLHCADPASLKVAVVGGVTRLFWVRDHRKEPSTGLPNPIGVTQYFVESAPAANGPWVVQGAPIAEDNRVYYEATLATADPARWYRLRSQLADSTQATDFSWPTLPDPAGAGFAYLKTRSDYTFTAGMWGNGPPNVGDVLLEWGNQAGFGYANPATSVSAPSLGITEYSGRVTNYPSSGPWVLRLRSLPQGLSSMRFDPGRRNNRICDRYGAHLFRPDHPRSVTMHRTRLASCEALGLTGMRLDFALDSYPSWYVAATPIGEDSAYIDIEPHMLAMLTQLKAGYPRLALHLNGMSVTTTHAGIYDYMPPATSLDCEFIGWSSPTATEPFRDADMLDGVIAGAHTRGVLVTCFSYAAADNIAARITSLARYWLVYTPQVHYQYMTVDNHQSVDYFPEFDIDMGDPVVPVLASRQSLRAGSVYLRRFRKGIACYNPTSAPVTVDFGALHYVVNPVGTHSPKMGGTGSVQFLGPFRSTTLAARRGAIVVTQPGLGR